MLVLFQRLGMDQKKSAKVEGFMSTFEANCLGTARAASCLQGWSADDSRTAIIPWDGGASVKIRCDHVLGKS